MGIKPIVVFDGKAPDVKFEIMQERARRKTAIEKQATEKRQQTVLKKAKHGFLSAIKNSNGQIDQLENLNSGYLTDTSSTEYSDCTSESDGEQEMSAFLNFEDCVGKIDFEGEQFRSLPLRFQHKIVEYAKQALRFDSSSGGNQVGTTSTGQFSSNQLSKMILISKLTKKSVEIEQKLAQELATNSDMISFYDKFDSQIASYKVASQDFMHSIVIKLAQKEEIIVSPQPSDNSSNKNIIELQDQTQFAEIAHDVSESESNEGFSEVDEMLEDKVESKKPKISSDSDSQKIEHENKNSLKLSNNFELFLYCKL